MKVILVNGSSRKGLVAEKSFARHAHDTDRDSLLRKQLGTFDQRRDFGTRREHHHSRFGGIDYDIGAFRKLGSLLTARCV